MTSTAWRTDEPCPVCGTGLVMVDDGCPVLRAECRLCGYGGPFDTADLVGGLRRVPVAALNEYVTRLEEEAA